VFFEESAEHLAAMEALLLDLDIANPDPEQLNAIFRAAHSIKGSAGTFGFTDLADTTHILENLLDRIRKEELVLRPDMVDAFLEAGDLLRDMLEAHQGHGEVGAEAAENICAKLRRLSSDTSLPVAKAVFRPAAVMPTPAANATERRHIYDIQFVPTEVSARGEGVQNLLAELRGLGELDILSSPEAAGDAVGFWQLRLRTAANAEAFSDQVDFIADNGAWRVAEDRSSLGEDNSPFGFLRMRPVRPRPRRMAFLPIPPARLRRKRTTATVFSSRFRHPQWLPRRRRMVSSSLCRLRRHRPRKETATAFSIPCRRRPCSSRMARSPKRARAMVSSFP
jgi:two-component system chemotaxis sensor kinase CheA